MAAVLTGCVPSSGAPGQTVSTALITGTGTSFRNGVSQVWLGTFPDIVSDSITASQVTVQDTTTLYVTITIDSACEPGNYDVVVRTDGPYATENAIGVNMFQVTNTPAPTNKEFIPSAWYHG